MSAANILKILLGVSKFLEGSFSENWLYVLIRMESRVSGHATGRGTEGTCPP